MVELHSHSNISDGYLDTRELIELAKSKKITHLAISNHDTTNGIIEAINLAKKYDITIIPSIEISAFDFKNKKKVHILGYYFDPKDDFLDDFCKDLRVRRIENSIMMIEKIVKLGYKISLEQVKEFAKKSTGIFKQHIMHALIQSGYSETIYSPLYYELFNAKDGKVFTPLVYIDVFDAVQAIKQCNGLAVLAHPALSDCINLVPALKKVGLDGIEVYHTYHNEEQVSYLLEVAKEKKLLVTGGSDYHGFYGKPDEILGKFAFCNEIVLSYN